MIPLIIIFKVEEYGNHCGIYFESIGYFDLSLIGTRELSLKDDKLPKSKANIYKFTEAEYHKSINFYRKQAKLPREIIAMEKQKKGWHLTKFAGDFILTFRKKRSMDVQSQNCVEWLLYGLEQSGKQFPNDIVTPEQLDKWCNNNLELISANVSLQKFN